jgi:hypothetical protein
MIKARSQRAEVGKLRRSDIFLVSHATQIISPVGVASSGLLSDYAAPERSLSGLWSCYSTNMPALTGLGPSRLKRLQSSLLNAIQGYSRSFNPIQGFLEKIFFYAKRRAPLHEWVRRLCPTLRTAREYARPTITDGRQINPRTGPIPTPTAQKMKSPLDSSCEEERRPWPIWPRWRCLLTPAYGYLHLLTPPYPSANGNGSATVIGRRVRRPAERIPPNLTGQNPADWTGKLNKK